MQWRDEGILLSVRRHGESAAIISLLTRDHGRHAGLVRGGAGKRLRGALQPGNQLTATWRARLSEHLGSFTVELARARTAGLLDWPDRLAALMAAAAVIDAALPERESHVGIYDGMLALLDALQDHDVPDEVWAAVYVRLELGLLAELGFGLDLSQCAVTGDHNDLRFVSPRSGRAVSAAAAAPYADRLLPLPSFLIGGAARAVGPGDLRDGLRLTGFFLERQVFRPHGSREPQARIRLVERISRWVTRSGDIVAS